jgi:DNA-binding PadR family transcriptional regulator
MDTITRVYELITEFTEDELNGFLTEVCAKSVYDELSDEEAAKIIEKLRERQREEDKG